MKNFQILFPLENIFTLFIFSKSCNLGLKLGLNFQVTKSTYEVGLNFLFSFSWLHKEILIVGSKSFNVVNCICNQTTRSIKSSF